MDNLDWMSTSIIRRKYSFETRQRRYEIGKQGELNVGDLLADYFGVNKVSYGFDNYSEGTNGYPDLVLKTFPPIAVEVKSISPFTIRDTTKGKTKSCGYVAIKRTQWYNELSFASSRNAKLILIVEVRMKDRGLYFWFNSEQIQKYMEKLKGERIHISFFNILTEGHSLIYQSDFEYLDQWNKDLVLENVSVLQPLY